MSSQCFCNWKRYCSTSYKLFHFIFFLSANSKAITAWFCFNDENTWRCHIPCALMFHLCNGANTQARLALVGRTQSSVNKWPKWQCTYCHTTGSCDSRSGEKPCRLEFKAGYVVGLEARCVVEAKEITSSQWSELNIMSSTWIPEAGKKRQRSTAPAKLQN